ncbi:GNAT family N-acetyltransferase [Niallia sp. 01092]|uniref:GNAT family N-acetyltransferase n=1 Tax=unclassified Niallia TaxID=2837522 RepID=UPI003FCF7E6B
MKIRKAVLKDAKSIAKVHVDSWRTTYENIVPAAFLQGLTYEEREKIWVSEIPNGHVFVAEKEDGQIVGFACGGKERSGSYKNFDGELYAIYLLKSYQGMGLGKSLVETVAVYLQGIGITSMIVQVLEENSACYFYEALGGKKVGSEVINISGKRINELVYGWNDIGEIGSK